MTIVLERGLERLTIKEVTVEQYLELQEALRAVGVTVRRWSPIEEIVKRQKYCPMCDRWFPARRTECPACGMPLEKAEK